MTADRPVVLARRSGRDVALLAPPPPVATRRRKSWRTASTQEADKPGLAKSLPTEEVALLRSLGRASARVPAGVVSRWMLRRAAAARCWSMRWTMLSAFGPIGCAESVVQWASRELVSLERAARISRSQLSAREYAR